MSDETKAKAKAKTSDEETEAAEPKFGDSVAYGVSTQHQTDFDFESGGYRSQQQGPEQRKQSEDES